MKALVLAIAVGANLGALIGVYTAGNEALSDYAPAGIAVTALVSLTALATKAGAR
jgi:hypothetical protein